MTSPDNSASKLGIGAPRDEAATASGSPGGSLGERACDFGVAIFAAFTLVTNLATAAGLGLDSLIALCGVTGALGVLGFALSRWWRGGGARSASATAATRAASPAADGETDSLPPAWRIAALALAAAALGLRVATDSLELYWGVALLACALFLWREFRTPARASAPVRSRNLDGLLIALCAICALVTATAHRGDADDAFYVNLVVAAVDHPDAPLLARDTLHGYDGVAMSMPVFRVLSIEIFEAVIARLSGWSAITVAHVLIPPLLAFLMPLAYARLLRLLAPKDWPWLLVCVIAYLLFVGDGELGYGPFAFLRMQQGKAMLLHVGVPLLASYGLEFGRSPTWRAWLKLALAQVAAVGLSSTALWLAPAVAGLAAASAVPGVARAHVATSMRTLALTLLSSLHPLGIALFMRGETERLFEEAVHRMESLGYAGGQLMAWSLDSVVGSGIDEKLALFAGVAVLGTASTPLFRRFAALFGAAFLLFFWSPITGPLVASHVTGPDTFFRVFWLLPIPIFTAAVLTSPLEFSSERLPRWLAIFTALLLVTLFFVLAPGTHTLSSANGVRFATPGPKAPPLPLEVAREIARHAGPNDRVLAPGSVARWLPLLHRHPYPLVVRDLHIDLLHPLLGEEEIHRRLVLSRLVAGEANPPNKGVLLAEAIERYPLAAVCLSGPALAWPELRRVLLDSELESQYRSGPFEVWARAKPVDTVRTR